MEKGLISVEIRNPLPHRIVIEKVLCRFIEARPTVTLSSDFQPVPIERNHSGDFHIIFRVPISCHPLTNYCRIGLVYREMSSGRTTTIWPSSATARPYIIVQNIPKRKEFLFISHKARQNTLLARALSSTLEKVGLAGYIAEDDPRPNLENYWSQKIYPAIESSMGLIVLWTKIAQRHDRNIMREVKHSKTPSVNKQRYVLAERGTDADLVSPRDSKEYVRFLDANSDSACMKLVEIIYSDFHDGTLRRSS